MSPAERMAYALRKRAAEHKWAGRSNEPGYRESATEAAQAVVRDEFVEMARIIEDGLGTAVRSSAKEREYEELKKEQDQ